MKVGTWDETTSERVRWWGLDGCWVKALAAMKTLAGISQPPPNTPYLSLGSGCIRYSNTASSSFSTQYMQFTGHDSTETCKNEAKLFSVPFLLKLQAARNSSSRSLFLLRCI
ncbi:hypothetical protein SDJN02_07156, partial [Cucurbita argyrosperma subsp. argyrosperma]